MSAPQFIRAILAVALLLLAHGAAGCAIDDQGEVQITIPGDTATYATYVQPAIGATCGTLDCHGDIKRPLTLYAHNGLRASADLRTLELSSAELAANMLSLAGVDAEQSKLEDNLVLRKPLAISAGGVGHIGNDVGNELFADKSHSLYRCLHAWLSTGVRDAADRAACEAAAP